MTAVIGTTMIAYGLNHYRCEPPLLPTALLALPIVAALLFLLAMLMGLHHPPFMVPEGWEWPSFTSIGERVGHAFALSLWTFIFGIPTVIVCGTIRRVVTATTRSTPHNETATNNPMDRSGGSTAS